MIGFGKGFKFDLIRTPYGRRGSGLFFWEDYSLPILRFSNAKVDSLMGGGDYAFDIRLYQRDGSDARYYYVADEGCITMTGYGEFPPIARLALTDRDHFRAEGNCAIRFELRSAVPGHGAVLCGGTFELPDHSGIEIDLKNRGRVMVRPLEGSSRVIAAYDQEKGCYASVAVEITPDENTGRFDAAVHETVSGEFAYDGEYETFEQLVADNKADFAEFRKNYRPVAKGYEEAAEYAKWLIWSHKVKPGGYYKNEMIRMHLQWLTACASWQQSYNAMASLANPAEAWRLLCTLFDYQDEKTGQLPGMLFSFGAQSMQAPFQGFALEFLIDQLSDSFITADEVERMIPKFSKWIEFWNTYRSAGKGDCITAVRTPHDSGWDDSTIFKDGFPVTTPDIMAFLVLLMDGTARLCEIAGRTDEVQRWRDRSAKLLHVIITEYWDGEKFVSKKNGEEPVDSMSIACYQPIVLGRRLPQEIIDKVAEKLTTEGEFLSPIGLCSESMKSPLCSWSMNFVLGRVVAPVNMILCVGLYFAGKKKEASMIARRFCDKLKEEGMILGFAPYDRYPLTGEKVPFCKVPNAMDPWPWSTWAANGFLTLASSIITEE